jgi:cell division protein ZapE
MTGSVRDLYEREIKAGRLGRDVAQAEVAGRLDRLARALGERAPEATAPGWRRLIGARNGKRPPPRGLYIWGAVGRGKTMLMDLFFAAVPEVKKRRIHFHAFMQDVHRRIALIRQAQRAGEVWEDADPVRMLADELRRELTLLCLDEFQVIDITDAMLLGRLFEALLAHGIVVVVTSNTAPRDLYRDGLNRQAFLPFIDLIEERLDVVCLDGGSDYRDGRPAGRELWLTPPDRTNRERLDDLWRALTGTERGEPARLPLGRRSLEVPQAAAGAARFAFEDLCARPLGAADYLAVAEAFHTVFIDAVPLLGEARRDERRRFTVLIDTLYDRHVRLVATAATDIEDLAPADARDHGFPRTVSRLKEMVSDDYWAGGAD